MKPFYKALFSFILFCITIPHSLFSQPAPEIQWQNTINGNGFDALTCIQQTSDGGYILGGYSNSNISGDKTESSNGLSDYWIVKIDVLGNIQWQNTIGGGTGDLLSSIQQTSDGGYILGGYSNSNISGDKTENCIGSYDYWVVKIDASGNIQWQNTIGGSATEYLHSIQQTIDGGYILGGRSNSDSTGDKTEDSKGNYDYWIVKIDSTGAIQWQFTYGGNDRDELYSVQQTIDGGYILGGFSISNISGDKTENSNGDFDYWIVKTDTSGSIQWQNTIGGNGNDYLYSLQPTDNGGFILGGFSSSDSSGDKAENSNGFFDYWMVKTDASGNIQWQNTIGGSEQEELLSIKQTIDGGYILGGLSESGITGDKTENNWDIIFFDYWIVKTDSFGNIEWQNTIGGNYEDNFRCLQQTNDGGFILGGFSSSMISGDKIEDCHGLGNYWIVKLTDNYNLIKGKLFIDENSNGIQDSTELLRANTMVLESFTSRFAFSEQNGLYSVAVLDTGSFMVTPSPLSYYNTVPASHSAYFSVVHQTDSLNDIAFQPAGVFNDLCITLTPMGRFRAGRNAIYILSYENVGTTTLAGTVIFFPDSNLALVSSSPVATSVSIDSVVWNVGTLNPFQSGSILITVNVETLTPIGTPVHSNARIEPVAGDANGYCNYASWEVMTIGSYDPNNILVDRDTVLTSELTNPPYLEYIINFQNTGNDTAFDVKVLNPIDTNKLQLNTLEFVSSSNPVNMNYKPWEKNMEFAFLNILLPDSGINEPASHGFVRYRIKPKSTLAAGDIIQNTAYIYFDFNQPVQTNVALTEIVLPTDLSPSPFPKERGITLSPNPLTIQAAITFNNATHEMYTFSLSDIRGRLIETATTTSGKIILEKGSKKEGVYFISLINSKSGERINVKIMIQ